MAASAGGSSFHSLMVLRCACSTVVVGIADRGLNADDLGAVVVCWQELQCGPGRSLSSTAV